jgi:hypothetical protein
MNKRFAAIGLSVGLVAGAGAGLALASPGIGGAATAESGTDSTTDASGASALQTEASGAEATPETPPEPGARLQEVLAPLVEDGTITQAQADAVVDRLVEAAPLRPGGHGGPRGHRGPVLEAAAGAIGVTVVELGEALRDGSTIAEVAAANGVEAQAVIDAMVAELETHLAEAVADGRKTQAQADEILANASERITAVVNGEVRPGGPVGHGGPGFGPGGRHGHGPGGSDLDDDAETADDAATTTTGS